MIQESIAKLVERKNISFQEAQEAMTEILTGQAPPSRTAVYNCLVPVVALTLGWLALGERPGPFQLAGAALIVGGVLVARNAPRRRGA